MPGAERILDFADDSKPTRLRVRHRQLIIEREGEQEISTPIDEAAVIVLASPRVSLSQSVLSVLMASGGALVVCDSSKLPSGLLLPLTAHFAQTQRMLAQASASLPRRKRVWQQIVRAKVRAQGAVLAARNGHRPTGVADGGLVALAGRVRSGDPDNIEAQAAQRYWPLLFGPEFRRRFDAPDQNRLLNYGYAVLRAAVGRAVCAAGLHPSLGVSHRGRNNAFCLADDLMEPYRPMVDDAVAEIAGSIGADAPLDKRTKPPLMGTLHERLEHAGERRTVFDWIGRSAASLARVLCGENEKGQVFFPDGLFDSEG